MVILADMRENSCFMLSKRFIGYFFLLLVISCNQLEGQLAISNDDIAIEFSEPPKWSKQVIWYELPVERFRNGDPTNDPTTENIAGSYPGFIPEGWSVTPWTQDWYKEDPYFSNLENQKDPNGNPLKKFVDKVQMRRYGGDLKGVLDKIDYLDSLGITAVYFRPLNDAPSLHKYDARNWRHIDVNFGPNPSKDKEIIAAEVPDDPSTWKMTEADELFLKVIDEFHKRDIRLILDYSWNHTGISFWAWQDILKNHDKSKYKDWYWIESFDNPDTPENEFKYHGWVGVKFLPEIRETQKQDLSTSLTSFEGNIYNKAAKQHIFNVARRWLDPNGDGDPSDGVDGYRLDVAAETPLGFWKDFRKHVRQINPEAYLIGEIWWEKWPDKLLDPEPFLRGDVFDAVMNYRWYRVARRYFNKAPNKISVSEFVDSLNMFRSNIRDVNDFSMMNYTGGFDTPRILTSLFNKNKYKYHCKVHENPEYKIHKPDSTTYQTLRLLLAQQYTYIGAPHIYAGDEMGMWGADDPSSRKPLIWPDYEFEPETHHPIGKTRPTDQVRFDEELFSYYRKLTEIRRTYSVLNHGELQFQLIDDDDDILAYNRYNDSSEVLAVFNAGEVAKEVKVSKKFQGNYESLLSEGNILSETKDSITIKLLPRNAYIFGFK